MQNTNSVAVSFKIKFHLILFTATGYMFLLNTA